MVDVLTIVVVCGVLSVGIIGSVTCCRFGEGCTFPCHCAGSDCDAVTGDCGENGCDDGNLGSSSTEYTAPWRGPGCQIGNVALHKSATQFPGRANTYAMANKSVDGNHDRINSCSRTGTDSSEHAWWEVDLGRNYVISNITITVRAINAAISLLNTDTFTWTNGSEPNKTTCDNIGDVSFDVTSFTLRCISEPIAQFVRLQHRQPGASLQMCEVMVIGYLYHVTCCRFGEGCTFPCHCAGSDCDVVTGDCGENGCDDGNLGSSSTEYTAPWRGPGCQIGNVALHKSATQFPGRANTYAMANKSVDGNHDQINSCSQTGTDSSEHAWWEVDLGRNYVISNITITVRAISPAISLSNTDTFTWTNGSEPNKTTCDNIGDVSFDVTSFTLRCISDPIAQFVRLQHRQPGASLQMCEVMVIGYLYHGGGSPCEAPSTGNGLSTWATAGIAITVLCILAIIVLYCRRHGVREKLRYYMQATIHCGNGGMGSENEGYEIPIASAHASSKPSSPPIDETRPTARDTESARNKASDTPDAASLETENGEFEDHLYESLDSPSDKDTEGSEAHVYMNVAVTSRPVRVAELAAYIEDLDIRSSGFQDEFTRIPIGGTALCSAGLSRFNKSKNRYNSECADDHPMVVLALDGGGKNETNYINASYIRSYKDIEKGNIAAQGPKASTVVDMWRLVWQTDANRIIMITKPVDNGWENCEQYWPNIGTKDYGLFKVTLTNIEKFADYVIRLLNVEYNEESRAVHHFQFTSWPDKDVPKIASNLLDFHRKIRVLDYTARGPKIVHCSSGSGATGTFLAIDYLLQQAKNEGIVDVQRYTSIMRSSRINMIETLAQYVFVYRSLLEALLCNDMAVADQDFAEVLPGLASIRLGSYKSKFLEQYELLDRLQTNTGDERYTGREEQNSDKNRTTDLVPCNRVRPVLTLAIDGTTDYINAAYVYGYHHHQAYLVTQLPLFNTVCDFWRLIHEHKVNTIVLMHAIDEDDETTPVYWPHSLGHPLTFGPLAIRLVMEEELAQGACVAREFVVTTKRKNTSQHQSVRQFELRGWPESAEVPANTRELLATLNQVSLWQKRSGIRPIIAQCRYGAHHSGLYVAASLMLERMISDRQVDVFHAVKQVRAARAELVPSCEQYTYLHYVANDYLRSAKMYISIL